MHNSECFYEGMSSCRELQFVVVNLRSWFHYTCNLESGVDYYRLLNFIVLTVSDDTKTECRHIVYLKVFYLCGSICSSGSLSATASGLLPVRKVSVIICTYIRDFIMKLSKASGGLAANCAF